MVHRSFCHKQSTLMVFDIDRFKVLNLSYGREKGDVLLQYVHDIFREELPEDQLFRNRSDHFVALIKKASKDEVERKVKKLIWRLETDIEEGRVVSFSLSFGICQMQGIKDIRTAYTNAMIAKNTVKYNQIIKYAFFDDDLRAFSMQNQEMVCTQMKEMISQGIDVKRVSVNLSRVHLKQPHITQKIKNTIRRFDINPSKLAFEITESALQENITMKKIVKELHDMGCRVDMDDYGTGISSLHSLANNDFDFIKLDKSFIDHIGDSKMESVIKSTIDLALRLNLGLVAEGVETREQVDFLMENGCYYAQGYYYSKPITKDEYMNLLKNTADV